MKEKYRTKQRTNETKMKSWTKTKTDTELEHSVDKEGSKNL